MPNLSTRKDPKLGPSDSSDTFSDRPLDPATDTDDGGTGERPTTGIDPQSEVHDEEGADRVVGPLEAGLGGGLDEAEEADVDPLSVPIRPTKPRP